MAETTKEKQFVLCIENKDCDDLEIRKVYQKISDEEAETEGYIRVIDESGEDYLYPRSYFVHIHLPQEAQEALRLIG
jgi:hypothetical protein